MPVPSSQVSRDELTSGLAGMLRGELPPAPEWLLADSGAALLDAAARHGVLPLVADRLARNATAAGADLSRPFRTAAMRDAAADMVRERELVRLLGHLDRAGIRAILFKGAQMAYSLYERPDLRPRLDTDVLVATPDRDRAHQVLEAAGYSKVVQFTGDLVSYQATYHLVRQDAVVHVVDLHWRIANPQRFGGLLTFEEISASAVPLDRLGQSALGLDPARALLVSCVHPYAHHAGSQRLIWDYDTFLLASCATETQWCAFLDLADDRGVMDLCAHRLERASRLLGLVVPEHARRRLEVRSADGADARYDDRVPQVRTMISDLRTLPRWSDRLRLVGQHVFPPAQYMRQVYAPASVAPLPLLYARRAVRGAVKWLGRS